MYEQKMIENRKILIISADNDYDTTTIVKWLRCLKKDYFRINIQDNIRLNKIDVNTEEISIMVNDSIIDLNSFDSYLYRRGKKWKFVYPNKFNENNSKDLFRLRNVINHHLKEENSTILEYVHYKLRHKRHLTDFIHGDVNKLIVLSEAKKAGLNIPDTSILTNTTEAKNILNKGVYITKPLSSNIYSKGKERRYHTYTEIISNKDLEYRKKYMQPFLLQNKVEKFIELRIFFIEKAFYTMAIFSQLSSEKYKVDYRMNGETRKVPYELPETVKEKLIILMKKLNLKTGSIDMIVDSENNYIFLEVNPVGQIGMTSVPTNFNLHRKIAEWL